MNSLQHPSFAPPNTNRPILPRTSRRRESGWDSTMFSTNLVAFHVPSDGQARWTHANVIHFNVDEGKTMILWRQYWEDRATSAYVTLPNGRKYLVLVPFDRTAYQFSQPIEDKLGLMWRGEVLVFACAVNNGLLVNMRTWQEDRERAWDVIRRYIVGDVDGHGSTGEVPGSLLTSSDDYYLYHDLSSPFVPESEDDMDAETHEMQNEAGEFGVDVTSVAVIVEDD